MTFSERKRIEEQKKAKALLSGIKLESLDDIGELMSIHEFKDACEGGMLMNFDGFGVYAFSDEQSDIEVYPSYIKKGEVNNLFTHVMWYNK